MNHLPDYLPCRTVPVLFGFRHGFPARWNRTVPQPYMAARFGTRVDRAVPQGPYRQHGTVLGRERAA